MPEHEIRKQLLAYNHLYKEMDEVYHSLARRYGISDCAFWILYMLREAEAPLTQSNICEQTLLSKQTINSALKNLEKTGYVTLASPTGSQKNKEILLTDTGEDLARQTVDQVFAMEQKAFSQFSAQERALFLQLNQKYVLLLQQEAAKNMDDTE